MQIRQQLLLQILWVQKKSQSPKRVYIGSFLDLMLCMPTGTFAWKLIFFVQIYMRASYINYSCIIYIRKDYSTFEKFETIHLCFWIYNHCATEIRYIPIVTDPLYLVCMAKISIKKKDHRKNSLWASRLWVSTQYEPLLGYISKINGKQNSDTNGLMMWSVFGEFPFMTNISLFNVLRLNI